MTTFKLVIAATVGLCAATAAAQEPRIVCTNPTDPFSSVCLEISQGPQLKPGRTGMSSATRAQRPANPGRCDHRPGHDGSVQGRSQAAREMAEGCPVGDAQPWPGLLPGH